jgi:hypothetical protein
MLSLYLKFLCIALIATLAGCAPAVPLQRSQIAAITHNTQSAELEQILAGATIAQRFELDANNLKYYVRQYDLQTGTKQEMTMICSPNCIPIFYSVPVTSEFIVLQNLQDKKILAWGTIEELSKDPDSNISSVMPNLKQTLAEIKKKK